MTATAMAATATAAAGAKPPPMRRPALTWAAARALAAELLRDGGVVVETVGTDGKIWLRTLWQLDGDSVTWCVPQLREDPQLVDVHLSRIAACIDQVGDALDAMTARLSTAMGRARLVARIGAAVGAAGTGSTLPAGHYGTALGSLATSAAGVVLHRWGGKWALAIAGREVRRWLGRRAPG